MGWVLLNNHNRQRLRLRPGIVLVGRAQNAHIRPNHQSVSRGHAEIVVEFPSALIKGTEVHPTPIFMIDRSSTGHSFVNTKPSAGKGVRTQLSHGDTLSFGVDPVNFSLQWSPIVLSCSSRMTQADLDRMIGLATNAGVFLTLDWMRACTHLVMDQLCLTPKLLSCVVDGGVPVATTFLEALANAEQVGPMLDHMQHQPQPATGAPDAVYAAELDVCARAPRSRRDLLHRVAVVFTSVKAWEALATPLKNAGVKPIEQFLLRSLEAYPNDVKRVLEGLERSKRELGPPDEVWLVPDLEEDIARDMVGPLLSLGARKCLTVPLPAVVRGILVGSREAAEQGASHITLSKASLSSGPETQQQLQRSLKAPNVKEESMKLPDAVKQESFPHTQEQVPARVLNAQGVASDIRRKSPDSQRHKPITVPSISSIRDGQKTECPALSSAEATIKKTPLDVPSLSLHRDAPTVAAKLEANAPAGEAKEAKFQFAGDVGRKSSDSQRDKPFSVTSLSCVADSSKAEPLYPPHVEVKTKKDPPDAEAVTKKEPPLCVPSFSLQHETPVVTSAKSEADLPRRETTEARPQSSVELPPIHEPKTHPTRTWLPRLAEMAQKNEPVVLHLQGVGDIDIRVLRASVCIGAADPTLASRKGLPVNGQVKRSAAGRECGGRNFKLFKKSIGQQVPTQREIVPTAPWAPPVAQGLAEAFASHRMDSESQLPPVGHSLSGL